MAYNDLMKDLSLLNTITLEDDSTAKVMRALIRLLSDPSGEVQNLAIECIGMLAQPSKIKSHHLEYLVEELAPHVFSKIEQARDIHALTLKAMILNLAPTATNNATSTVIKRMLPKFIDSLPTCAPDDAARIDVLDLIGEVLLRFGDAVPEMHKSCLKVMVDHLYSSRSARRKKAIIGIGHLASVINAQLYDELVTELLTELTKASTSQTSQTRTLVVALSTIARASGSKLSKHTPQVLPHLIRFLSANDKSESENDDLREASLQGLEVFLYRSPQEVAAFEKDVIEQFTRALSYDPNYEHGDEDEDEQMEGDEVDEDEDYSDDEGVTWKVRRAAAKAFEAMVSSHRESILFLSQTIGPIIIERFKEREETVRTEILSIYIALLNRIAILIPDLQKGIVSTDENFIVTDDIVVVDMVHNLMRMESPGKRASYHIILAHLLSSLKTSDTPSDDPIILMLAEYLVLETNRSCIIKLKEDTKPESHQFEIDWSTCVESLSLTNLALCMRFIGQTVNKSHISTQCLCTVLMQTTSQSWIVSESAQFALKIIAEESSRDQKKKDDPGAVERLIRRYSCHILNRVSLSCTSSTNYHMAPILFQSYLAYSRSF
ncbi:hypothetical protein CRE_31369 [Caenorhabditis remanei]|uniref:TATA-binding protein interacting (TIP20) domain-containing protein n=1 Tax=Caenorhabditis remanei TaxID=31234 RepID=E3MY84_CAERE|nr:hypothetical protein CRE_31369 [Caenorhabditis remanei]